MQKIVSIKGKITFVALEMGFWGIIDEKGGQWQPINFPEQLKLEGASVTLKLKKLEDQASFQMWGEPVKIISFHTLSPA
jgi:hypothetical protein